jgi:DNA-binding CsgD family transcriptional regulator
MSERTGKSAERPTAQEGTMSVRELRDRIEETRAAASLLCDTQTIVSLAVDAYAAACPHGFALAFTRRMDGSYGCATGRFDGAVVRRDSLSDRTSSPWIVDIDHVPTWQQDSRIEPIHAGIHGPDYFSPAHPSRRLFRRGTPDYGRMMVCHDARLVAWVGVLVDGRRGFRNADHAACVELSSRLALPLRVAAALDDDVRRIALAPRQSEILGRVAQGFTNKRIARDLEISPATVKTILERLFRVSGASNRAALVEWWRRK